MVHSDSPTPLLPIDLTIPSHLLPTDLSSNELSLLRTEDEADVGPLLGPLLAMLIIFTASLFASAFPALSKRVSCLRIPPIVFFIGKHFGTGVILSTAFVHLLQDAFESLLDPRIKKSTPLSKWVGLIILGSLLSIFLVEYISTSYVDRLHAHSHPQEHGHSHGHAHHMPPPPPNAQSPTSPTSSSRLGASQPASKSSRDLEPRQGACCHEPTCTPPSGERASLLAHAASRVSYTRTTAESPPPSRRHSFPHCDSPARASPRLAPAPPAVAEEDSYFTGHHHRHTSARNARRLANPRSQSSTLLYGPEDFGQGRIVGVGHVHRHGEDVEAHSHSHGFDGEIEEEEEEEEEEGDDGEVEEEDGEQHGECDEEAGAGKALSRKRQVVGILVLQMGIMMHSLVIGLTLSITSGPDFTSLLVAVVFHQLFEGLSLGIRIANLPTPNDKFPWLKATLAALFSVTVPFGITVGLLAFGSSTGSAGLHLKFVQGVMCAISAGMLIYAACVEMIAGDFVMDPILWRSGLGKQALALGSLLAGAAGMAIIG